MYKRQTLTCGRSYTAACEVLPRFYELGGRVPDEEGRVQVVTAEMRAAFELSLIHISIG